MWLFCFTASRWSESDLVVVIWFAFTSFFEAWTKRTCQRKAIVSCIWFTRWLFCGLFLHFFDSFYLFLWKLLHFFSMFIQWQLFMIIFGTIAFIWRRRCHGFVLKMVHWVWWNCYRHIYKMTRLQLQQLIQLLPDGWTHLNLSKTWEFGTMEEMYLKFNFYLDQKLKQLKRLRALDLTNWKKLKTVKLHWNNAISNGISCVHCFCHAFHLIEVNLPRVFSWRIISLLCRFWVIFLDFIRNFSISLLHWQGKFAKTFLSQ